MTFFVNSGQYMNLICVLPCLQDNYERQAISAAKKWWGCLESGKTTPKFQII